MGKEEPYFSHPTSLSPGALRKSKEDLKKQVSERQGWGSLWSPQISWVGSQHFLPRKCGHEGVLEEAIMVRICIGQVWLKTSGCKVS